MRHYILFAQNEPTSNRDVWLIQNVQTSEYVFRSSSVQAARDFLKNLEAAE